MKYQNEIDLIKEKNILFFCYLDNNKINYIYKNNQIIINDSIYIKNDKLKKYLQLPLFTIPDNIIFKKDLNLNTGYNYQFGNKTIIKGNLNASETNINFGYELIVNGNVNISFSNVEKYPDYFLIKGNFDANYVKNATKLGKTTIVEKSFDIHSSVIENLGNCFCNGGAIYLNDKIKTINPNILSENKQKYIAIFLDCFMSIKLPESFKNDFKNKKIKISCNKTFIENSYEFINYHNVKFYPLNNNDFKGIIKESKKYTNNNNSNDSSNLSYLQKLDFNLKKITDNKLSGLEKYKIYEYLDKNKITEYDFCLLNLFNYFAPTRLHYKLLTNCKSITSDEIKYFKENKDKLEKYIQWNRKNIIYYCRTQQAINFLSNNNYSYKESEYNLITNNLVKAIYEKELILEKINKNNIKKKKTINNIFMLPK